MSLNSCSIGLLVISFSLMYNTMGMHEEKRAQDTQEVHAKTKMPSPKLLKKAHSESDLDTPGVAEKDPRKTLRKSGSAPVGLAYVVQQVYVPTPCGYSRLEEETPYSARADNEDQNKHQDVFP